MAPLTYEQFMQCINFINDSQKDQAAPPLQLLKKSSSSNKNKHTLKPQPTHIVDADKKTRSEEDFYDLLTIQPGSCE